MNGFVIFLLILAFLAGMRVGHGMGVSSGLRQAREKVRLALGDALDDEYQYYPRNGYR